MSAFLALLFSLIAPGAGHLLEGFYTEGIVLGVLFAFGKSVLLPLVLRVGKVSTLKRTLQILYGFNCGYMVLICYAALSSFVRGFFVQQIHFWPALLGAVAVTLAYKNTLNAFVFTALCGRSGVYGLVRNSAKTPTEKK